MRDDLIRRLAARIAPNDVDETAATLSRSPELEGDLSWLEDMFAASESLPLPEVPSSVSATLHGLMPEPVDLRWNIATPIHDSRSAGELVGVRGQRSTTAWTAMFTSASADVVLDGEPTAAGLTKVTGQVLSHVAGSGPFGIHAVGPTDAATRSDDLGQFDLGVLPNGEYSFEARADTFGIRWHTEVGDK